MCAREDEDGPEAPAMDCEECSAEAEARAFARRLRLFSAHMDHRLTSCVLFRYLERWDKMRGWCTHQSLSMLASVNTLFAQRVASVDEKSLAHIGKENARRLSVDSTGPMLTSCARIKQVTSCARIKVTCPNGRL